MVGLGEKLRSIQAEGTKFASFKRMRD